MFGLRFLMTLGLYESRDTHGLAKAQVTRSKTIPYVVVLGPRETVGAPFVVHCPGSSLGEEGAATVPPAPRAATATVTTTDSISVRLMTPPLVLIRARFLATVWS